MTWLQTYFEGELRDWGHRLDMVIDPSHVEEDLYDFPLLIRLSNASGANNVDVSEVLTHFNTGNMWNNIDGLVAEYTMDYCSAGIVYDTSGVGGPNGVLNVNTSVSTNSFVLNGLEGAETSTLLRQMAFSTDISFTTLSFWVKRINLSYTASLFTNSSANNGVIAIANSANGYYLYTYTGVSNFSNLVLNDNIAWHHVAFVRESSTQARFYLDGVAATGTVGWTSTSIKYVGRYNVSANQEVSNLDQIRFYNRQLTLEEIQQLASEFDYRYKMAVAIEVAGSPIEVPCEIDCFTNNELLLWAKIPQVSSSVQTRVYLYYDKAADDNIAYIGQTGSVVAQNVWDADFVLVHHYNQDPSGGANSIKDSTSNNYHGSPQGTMSKSNLYFDGMGGALIFDGANNWVDVSFTRVLGDLNLNLTVEAVVKGVGPILSTERSSSSVGDSAFYVYNNTANYYVDRYTSSPYTALFNIYNYEDFLPANNISYVGYSMDGTNSKFFANDVSADLSVTWTWGSTPSSYSDVELYRHRNYTYSFCPTGSIAYFSGRCYDLRISNVNRSEAWLKLSSLSSRDALLLFETYTLDYAKRNICIHNNYVYKPLRNSIDVYEVTTSNLVGHTNIGFELSSIWVNDDFVYIGTTSSGILRAPLTVSGSLVFSSYKAYPNITSNYVTYIHGNGDYICSATTSGVDRYKVSDNSREYFELADVEKCYQTTAGDYYYYAYPGYNINDLDGKIFDWSYIISIDFSKPTHKNNYNLKITLSLAQFPLIYQESNNSSDFRFLTKSGQVVPHYIETWDSISDPEFWVKLPIYTDGLYVIYGNSIVDSTSSGDNTFILFDNFEGSTLNSTKWFIQSASVTNTYTVSDSNITFNMVTNANPIYLYSQNYFTEGTLIHKFKTIPNTNNTDLDYAFGFSSGITVRIGVTDSVDEHAHTLASTVGTKYAVPTYKVSTFTYTENLQTSLFDDELLTSSGVVPSAFRRLVFTAGNGSTEPDLSIDWVKLANLDLDPPTMTVNDRQDIRDIFNASILHVVYNDGSSFDYIFGSSDLPGAANINDVFVTEGTSIYSPGNVMFVATDIGAVVLEENRGDELNCRKKLYLSNT